MAELTPPTNEDGWDVHLAYHLMAPVIQELLDRVAKLERDLAYERAWRTPLAATPVFDDNITLAYKQTPRPCPPVTGLPEMMYANDEED